MKRVLCAAALGVALLGGDASASDVTSVKAAVRHLIADSNAGNDSAFLADFTEPAVLVDEYAPFNWLGAKDGWLNAFNAYNKQNAISDAKTTPLAFRHVNVGGDRAYVVLRSLYTYKDHGKLKREPGTEVFTLQKSGGKWLADGYAWFSKDTNDQGADAAAITASIQNTFDQFNAGKADPATLGWQAVIDEFPQYKWQGTTAAGDWFGTFAKNAAQDGVTDTKVTLGAPTHLSVAGDNAYVVYPATLTSKIKGKPAKEAGQFVFTLQKPGGAWRINTVIWATD
jgi:ketosteroid isomerase-like protein